VYDAAQAGYPGLRRHDVAGKRERPEKPEPAQVEDAKTFGEALKEMGFLSVDRAKRVIIRQGPPRNPLTHWKKSGERDRDGT
jgi:hypothetical protein